MARRKLSFWYRITQLIIWPLIVPFTKRVWAGKENFPAEGGFLVAANHISHADPVILGHFLLYESGREPRYLGKASVFEIPVIGRIARGAGHIPVHRESAGAVGAFGAAADAVRRGECVMFYPEGTITRDPDLWPMAAKTGVARVALLTGAPVIPVAQWGAQEFLAPYTKKLRLLPRKTIRMLAGPPVDLSAFQGKELSAAVLRQATEVIMADVTRLLEEIRGEKAPAERFTPGAEPRGAVAGGGNPSPDRMAPRPQPMDGREADPGRGSDEADVEPERKWA